MKKWPVSNIFSKLVPIVRPVVPGFLSIFTLILIIILCSRLGWAETKDEASIKTSGDFDLSKVVAVLPKGASPKLQDKPDGGTALMGAAKRGNLALVKLLLETGADVNAKVKSEIYPWSNGWTALMYASNHVEVVKLLLERGADVKAMAQNGNTVLRSAALEGNVEVVKLLLDKGADVNAMTHDGNTALRTAAFEGHVEVMKLLLDRGADVNGKSQVFNPLMAASITGHASIVELLLDKGADVNATDSQSFTALAYAAMEGFSNIVKILVARGADVNVKNDDGDTALTLVMSNLGRESSLDAIKPLMENIADTNARTEIGDIPLIDPVQLSGGSWYQEQVLEIVQILLDKGAEVNVKNNNGDTALTLATKNNNQEVVNLLLNRGAKLE